MVEEFTELKELLLRDRNLRILASHKCKVAGFVNFIAAFEA